MKKNKIVVIVPVYRELTENDERSLDFLRNNIKEHDKIILCPINYDLSKVNTDGFKVKKLSKERFKDGFNRTLMSRRFYAYFKDYDYMLYHKLGSIVFGNDEELTKWASKEHSYLGAPWFKKSKSHKIRVPGGVGKGALSLRHIPSFLNTFKKKRMSTIPANRQSKQFFLEWRYWNRLKRFGAWTHMQQRAKPKGAMHHIYKKFDKPEDIFWAFFAIQVNPGFRIASFDEGYKFAIEHTPYRIYKDTIPFGITECAWKCSDKWDDIIKERHPNAKVEKSSANKSDTKKKVARKAPVKKKTTVKKAPAKNKTSISSASKTKKATVKKVSTAKKVVSKKTTAAKKPTAKKKASAKSVTKNKK